MPRYVLHPDEPTLTPDEKLKIADKIFGTHLSEQNEAMKQAVKDEIEKIINGTDEDRGEVLGKLAFLMLLSKGVKTKNIKAVVEKQKTVKGVMKVKKMKKVMGADYQTYRKLSVNNPESKTVTLGRWEPGEGSYTKVAERNKTQYFNLNDWDKIKKQYNLTDDDMFELFNKPFLQDNINNKSVFQFSHNPLAKENMYKPNGKETALYNEYKYIKASGKYKYVPETMTFKPKK